MEGEVEIELVCAPAFDYGRVPAEWTLVGDDRHAADATGAGQTMRLATDLKLGIEGSRARARHFLRAGEAAVLQPVLGERRWSGPTDAEDATERLDATARFWRRWLGPGAPDPRSPLARPDPALGARRSRGSPTCRPARPWRR